jgi:hypothetical protein
MSKVKWFTLLMLLSGSLLFVGCGENGTEENSIEEAAQKVDQANELLEDVLYELIQSELEGLDPTEVDFTPINALYKEALNLDPSNLEAHFGAGLTEILTISMDSEFALVYDEWAAFLDTASFFGMEGGGPPLSVRPSFPARKENLSLPADYLAVTTLGLVHWSLEDPPQVSDIQNVIEQALLPKINYALERLYRVDDDQNFQFIITPRMQGDEDEDPIELDLTEIYALEMSLNLLKSFCSAFISYDYDFASYDSTGLHAAIQQSSSFLSLRSGGADDMATAKSSFLSAVDNLEDGIEFLKGETDNQDDDLIKIDPDFFTEQDLDSILAYLPEVRGALTGIQEVTGDFDRDGDMETIEVGLGNIFDDPIENYKAMFPPYTGSVERDSVGHYEWWWNGQEWEYIYVLDYTYFAPVITWEADYFEEWIFPDPTFNGALPGMTDAEFKATFGLYEEDWSKRMKLGWE